jgi:cellulose biosynthesis protein BcsQ
VSVPIITFFNNKGGVGKTSLVYHLSWMYADLGLRVVAVDLDPQANLTSAFLDEDRLVELWEPERDRKTVFGCVEPFRRGLGDVREASLEPIDGLVGRLALVPGDLALSSFEDRLSEYWPRCLDRDELGFRVMSAFWRIAQSAAARMQADVILIDVGPNLGAINRAALIAADHLVVPMAPDLYAIQGLRNLGPTIRRWRAEWQERLTRNPAEDLDLPPGGIHPLGYVVLQHSVRLDRPMQAYDQWLSRIPGEYQRSVLDLPEQDPVKVDSDPHCLALLKHYHSLMPLAQEARKPVFHLKPADGALGAHGKAVAAARREFESLAHQVAEQAGLAIFGREGEERGRGGVVPGTGRQAFPPPSS